MGFQVYNSQGQELQNLTGTAGGDLTGTYPNPTMVSRRVAYQSSTSNYTISATSFSAAANFFSSDLSFTADGTSTYVIEVQLGTSWYPGTTLYNVYASLRKGTSTEIPICMAAGNATRMAAPSFRYPYTPSAGTETFNVRVYKEAGGANGTVEVGFSSIASLAYIAAYKL